MGATAKTVDMSGVKERGNFNTKRVPEGDYLAKVTKVEDSQTKGEGKFQYLFTIKLEKYSQNSYPYYCQLDEKTLWKIRNLMIAGGINVPKKRMKLDPNKVVGRKIGVTMVDDEYEGKLKSTIDAVFPAAELADGAVISDDEDDFDEESGPQVAGSDDDTEEEAAPKAAKKDKKGKKKKGKKSQSDDENLEDIDISDV